MRTASGIRSVLMRPSSWQPLRGVVVGVLRALRDVGDRMLMRRLRAERELALALVVARTRADRHADERPDHAAGDDPGRDPRPVRRPPRSRHWKWRRRVRAAR